MFLQELQYRNAPVLHNRVVRDHRDIDQRKRAVIDYFCPLRRVEQAVPVHREGIGRGFALIKKNGNHQWKMRISRFQMALHCGDGIAHQAKRHLFVRRALMLNKYVDIAGLIIDFQRVQHVGIVGAQVFLNKIT